MAVSASGTQPAGRMREQLLKRGTGRVPWRESSSLKSHCPGVALIALYFTASDITRGHFLHLSNAAESVWQG